MKTRLVIVDYKMGNLCSVANALAFLGADVTISDSPTQLHSADAVILPGVGAFGAAMENLKSQQMIDPLNENILGKKKPFLGICLGMQLLSEGSEEKGNHAGLGWIPGYVRRLKPNEQLRVPHVGWNLSTIESSAPLFNRCEASPAFYFVHSYHLECPPNYVLATCDYGGKFVAAVRSNNIFATQFHPEKSQAQGLKVLRNFMNFVDEQKRGAEC